MNPTIGFMVEHTLVNLVPILLGAVLLAWLTGKWVRVHLGNSWRAAWYGLGGMAAGLAAYGYFDAAGRGVSLVEVVLLAPAMFVLAWGLSTVAVRLRAGR